MDNQNLWAELYCQRENTINGRHVWLYLLHTAIGNITIVDYEGNDDPAITRKIFDENYAKADKHFDSVCMKKIKGVL